jgi:hypothetical protein
VALAFFHDLAEKIVSERVDLDTAAKPDWPQTRLLAVRYKFDGSQDSGNLAVVVEDGVNEIRACDLEGFVIRQIAIPDSLCKAVVHRAHRKNVVLRFYQGKESKAWPQLAVKALFET